MVFVRLYPVAAQLGIGNMHLAGMPSQGALQDLAHQMRGVVLLAQMRRDDGLQAGMNEGAQKLSRLSIAKVSIVSCNALFEKSGVLAGLQQCRIVIEL